MTQEQAEPQPEVRIMKTASLAYTDDCFLIATVVDSGGNIQLFSNGTGSKARAREALTKVLAGLGADIPAELSVAV